MLLFCGPGKGMKLEDESSEHIERENVLLDQGLDMSVERKLKIEEVCDDDDDDEVEEEEEQNGVSHGSPHDSDNEGSNCGSVTRSPDDEASRERRADARSVFSTIKTIE